ncbi:unnamed protein product, partial [Mesorhabditis spiculigera]
MWQLLAGILVLNVAPLLATPQQRAAPNPDGAQQDIGKEESVNLKIAIPNPNELEVLNLQLMEPLLYKAVEKEIFLAGLEEPGVASASPERLQWELQQKKVEQGMADALASVMDEIQANAILQPENVGAPALPEPIREAVRRLPPIDLD